MSLPYFTPEDNGTLSFGFESECERNINANLLLTIRFSASIPDLYLDVQTPETTTAAGLKQLIRAHLPFHLSTHRLRLIYAGRGLEDATALTISLRLPPPPPPKVNKDESAKDKGKEPVREQPRVYIHCSIGDIILSESDLAEEAAAASTLLRKRQDSSGGEYEAKKQREKQKQQVSTTTPAPRGFDRLLTAGFTAAEVTALRSQFMAVQSVSRTPDTMPSGAELRELEDRWLDEGTTTVSDAMGTGVGARGAGGDGDDDGSFGTGSRGAIDDMLWGTVMGFFWPMGCAMWLRREEGVWSWRKGLAVFVGVVVNAAFGAMRIM
ncbi:DSC3 family protein, partial [Aspergillus ruber CBS 135680]